MNLIKTLLAVLVFLTPAAAADFRLGIIGTDTSHVIALTTIFNDASAPGHVPGFKVVAAFKGGSPDVESSYTRVDKFAAELQSKWSVEIVPDIPTLCSKVDGILLESVDGRTHLAQARQAIPAHKPMFIDKPLASTLEDAREIARLAQEAGVPWFTTSDERYNPIVAELKGPDLTGATVWGPGPTEEHHALDLSWYAIHPIEMLYALMGTGCEEVTRIVGTDTDVMVGRWKGGRIGTVRSMRPYGPMGAVVFRPSAAQQSEQKSHAAYGSLAEHIGQFFQSGVAPVPHEETLEIFSFMDAAQRSKAANGQPMRLR
jgi:hypothetical protein